MENVFKQIDTIIKLDIIDNKSVQCYYDSIVDENSYINRQLRICFYIHGWDRVKGQFCLKYPTSDPDQWIYRELDQDKLKHDLQKILEKI